MSESTSLDSVNLIARAVRDIVFRDKKTSTSNNPKEPPVMYGCR